MAVTYNAANEAFKLRLFIRNANTFGVSIILCIIKSNRT